jgi:hypothetical protein
MKTFIILLFLNMIVYSQGLILQGYSQIIFLANDNIIAVPIESTTVTIYSGDNILLDVDITDSTGKYEFTGLYIGYYEINFYKSGFDVVTIRNIYLDRNRVINGTMTRVALGRLPERMKDIKVKENQLVSVYLNGRKQIGKYVRNRIIK